MNDDVPPSSEELDIAFTQGKNGKLVFARDAEGNFFLDSRGVYKKAMQQLIDSQRDQQPGAIEAQQRGERLSDLPITFNYGEVETLPKGGPQVGSAVFILDVASKEPTS